MPLSWPQESRPQKMMLHSVQALQSLKIASKPIDLAGIRLVRSGVALAASGVVGRILAKKLSGKYPSVR
jgi:hypothetical protein